MTTTAADVLRMTDEHADQRVRMAADIVYWAMRSDAAEKDSEEQYGYADMCQTAIENMLEECEP